MQRRRYSDKEVQEDVKSFFLDVDHWAYQYGDRTPLCNPDSPYHRKQIEVLFESKYQHWVTDRAVSSLIDEHFLRERRYQLPEFELYFVYRYNLRRIAREINKRIKIVRQYSVPSVSDATGDQAEIWAQHLFRSNSFRIVGRNTKEYKSKEWTKTNHNLDFIIEKDGISYGVEVKNKFPYLDDDIFDIKLEICSHLGVIPLFVFRTASESQIGKVSNQNGRILIFKTKVFPPGYRQLVNDIWNNMRLPVFIWKEIPSNVERLFLRCHADIKKQVGSMFK